MYVTADHCLHGYENVWRTYKWGDTSPGDFLGRVTGRVPFLTRRADIGTIVANPDPKSRKYLRFGHTNIDIDGMVYSSSNVAVREAIPIVGEGKPKVGMRVCVAGGHFTTDCDFVITGQKLYDPNKNGTGRYLMWAAQKNAPCRYVGQDGKARQFRGGDSGGTVYQPLGSSRGVQAKVLGTLGRQEYVVNNLTVPFCGIAFSDLTALHQVYGGHVITAW